MQSLKAEPQSRASTSFQMIKVRCPRTGEKDYSHTNQLSMNRKDVLMIDQYPGMIIYYLRSITLT